MNISKYSERCCQSFCLYYINVSYFVVEFEILGSTSVSRSRAGESSECNITTSAQCHYLRKRTSEHGPGFLILKSTSPESPPEAVSFWCKGCQACERADEICGQGGSASTKPPFLSPASPRHPVPLPAIASAYLKTAGKRHNNCCFPNV